jgi:hypothetical protein
MTPPTEPPKNAIKSTSPRLIKVDAGQVLWRVHSSGRSAVSFKDEPTDDVYGGGRFDGTRADPYPFMYAALEPQTALLETVARSLPFPHKGLRLIKRANVESRTISQVLLTEPVTLISLMSGVDLTAALQDEWLIQCDPAWYAHTRRWASWLRVQVSTAQGIVWPSRRNVGSQAVVLFGDRCQGVLELASEPAVSLADKAGADWLNQQLLPYRTRIRPPMSRLEPG